MRLFLALVALCVSAAVVVGYPQSQNVDPAYLRQYYAHLAQANREEGTPIYESGNQEQSQAFAAPQIRQYQAAAPQQAAQYIQPQPQQQPQYKPAPKQAPRRPVYQQSENAGHRLRDEEEDEEADNNASYQFGFDVKDDEFTNYQNRQESRDNGVIKGSYSVVDSDGFIRTVKYTADPKEGFKAEVVREPTDIVVKIPPPHQPERQQEQRAQNHQYPAHYKQQQAAQQAQRQAQYQYE